VSKPDHETIVKRASRRHDEEAHGGAWKVAFADFVLALMCLFMVLWVLAARDKEELSGLMTASGGHVVNEGRGPRVETVGGPRGSLIERFPMPARGSGGGPMAGEQVGEVQPREPGQRVRYESPAQLQDLAELLKLMSEQAGLQANLQTIVTPYGLRIMLHDTDREGMFQLGSATPGTKFKDMLRRMGPLFARIENSMLIVGHTDARPFAGAGPHAASNWTLSSDRAAAARAHLMDGGMPARNVLQVVGMVDRAPFHATDAHASVNRRIELLVLTEGQSGAIAAMFGAPTDQHPLVPGVQTEMPSLDMLASLRASLLRASQSVPGLQQVMDRAAGHPPIATP